MGKQQLSIMARVPKKRLKALSKLEKGRLYPIDEALDLLKDKEFTYVGFDASVDIDMHLGVDPRKPNQMVRGTVTLPHGTGRAVRVLALVGPEQAADAEAAGADYVGLDEYIDKIQQGWFDFDVIVTTPDVMPRIARLGRILGPRGLMPNPKAGTVTTKVKDTINELKRGKIEFKVDRYGIIHNSVGRVSMPKAALKENIRDFVRTILRSKPSATKGTYVKSVTLSSTMSPGIDIDLKSVS